MHGPPLVAWLLVVLGAATGAYCLFRTRRGCPGTGPDVRRVARAEALMGLGMAVMAVPVSVLAPPLWVSAAFGLVFGVAAVRALLLARHGAHHLHHAVGAGAMVYMAVAMAEAGAAGAAGAAHAGHTPAGSPAATGLLLVYFAVYVLAAGVRLVSVPATVAAAGTAAAGGGVPVGHAPELASACRVSMAIGMFAMLLTL
ncbi:DUF5134 domain-containing protein [Actinacidiphila sp. bgisy167]|uniref:DUF5134 domain-containing protein n=1 Tax=Actinacidiphila sp. bgisy167 TaxID=3413797 RepID=UPI003D716572